jgi:hypothetical protein
LFLSAKCATGHRLTERFTTCRIVSSLRSAGSSPGSRTKRKCLQRVVLPAYCPHYKRGVQRALCQGRAWGIPPHQSLGEQPGIEFARVFRLRNRAIQTSFLRARDLTAMPRRAMALSGGFKVSAGGRRITDSRSPISLPVPAPQKPPCTSRGGCGGGSEWFCIYVRTVVTSFPSSPRTLMNVCIAPYGRAVGDLEKTRRVAREGPPRRSSFSCGVTVAIPPSGSREPSHEEATVYFHGAAPSPVNLGPTGAQSQKSALQTPAMTMELASPTAPTDPCRAGAVAQQRAQRREPAPGPPSGAAIHTPLIMMLYWRAAPAGAA